MPISLRTSLLSLGCHLAQPLLYRPKSTLSTLSNAVNVLSVKIQQTAKIVNATQHYVCRFFIVEITFHYIITLHAFAVFAYVLYNS